MKYLLLVYHNEEAFAKMSEAVRSDMLAESIRLCHELHAKGQYVHASPLQPTSTATCVHVRHGARLITDGPFIETREQLAGYFLIDARDLDDAIAVAGRIPGTRIGTVEIRPVRTVPGLPNE
ncbi:MAG: YciI family protein [Nitrospira sp.]|nr:YciI family protein [Nitrospira sp.]MCP9473718.1 YciI family protein [Nitrospira sp.]